MAKDAKGHGSEKRGGGSGKNYLDPFDPRYADSAARYAASHSEPQVQANLANVNARGALAQGHPKSAPVDVHPSMEQQMESHPAHSRVSPAVAVATQHGIPTSHLDAMKEAIGD